MIDILYTLQEKLQESTTSTKQLLRLTPKQKRRYALPLEPFKFTTYNLNTINSLSPDKVSEIIKPTDADRQKAMRQLSDITEDQLKNIIETYKSKLVLNKLWFMLPDNPDYDIRSNIPYALVIGACFAAVFSPLGVMVSIPFLHSALAASTPALLGIETAGVIAKAAACVAIAALALVCTQLVRRHIQRRIIPPEQDKNDHTLLSVWPKGLQQYIDGAETDLDEKQGLLNDSLQGA